ncbi:TonB-dependent siderophore receptor [Sphingomonas sp. MMS12-HWE2-04]|uniref:TonB-dependent siderophore receptor n=1 Tax=Sphingomonas sp. MMS12-HWE2-04 TaxID=3234199 RepID=UPI00385008C0
MITRRLAAGLLLGTTLSTPAFAQSEEREDSSVIVVTGQQAPTISSAGTKSQVPLAETPQSISVIDSEEIAGLGLQNLNQVLRYVAGVTPEQRGASAEVYDQFKLRGFDALQYLDGLRAFSSPSGYAAAQVDMSRLDRVEVVKGPASALYGQSGPGGLVALTSKLPIDRESYGAVSATYGNYDLYRVDADIGGTAGIVGWRVYGSANGAHTQQTFGKRERETISGAMTIGQGQSTSLTFLVNYSHDPYNGTYGVFPASGTFIANPNGKLPTDFDGGEPDNFFSREQFGTTYIFNHDFGSGWGFRSSGRYQDITSKLGIVYIGGSLDASDPTQATFNRASYATDEAVRAWTFDNQLTGKIETGPLTHNVMIGFDSQVVHSNEDFAFGSFGSINGYNPVYGTAPVPATPAQVPNPFGGSVDYNLRQRGLYAQDEISWGGLRVALSGRQDWARVEAVGSPAENSEKFTYRAGALYKTSFGLAPYISYATSFEPQTGLVLNDDNSLGNAKPSEGKQLEIGAKYQVPGTQILVSGAWFDIDQTNLLTSVQGQPYSIQTGKVNSSGVEVEATAPLPLGFEAKLAFSRQDVKDDAGKRILGVGRGNTTFNLEWAPKQGALQGFAIGGAVRHLDEVYAGTYFDGVTYNTPSYTLFDALARYDLGKLTPRLEGLTVSVNATNIFDKKYLSACYLDYGWCWYGNRRTVQGTIGFRW